MNCLLINTIGNYLHMISDKMQKNIVITKGVVVLKLINA